MARGSNKDFMDAFAGGGGIHIKPSHEGRLHRDMGVAEDKPIPVSSIRSKLAKDKASGNSAGVKRDVFAINAKTKFHH